MVGHIAFSPVTISDGSPNWYGLGPVSVLPAYQRRGIGSALIREGLSRLSMLGAAGCCLVGHPEYYGRFGFENPQGLIWEGVPPAVFFALSFDRHIPQGMVEFHQAFKADGQSEESHHMPDLDLLDRLLEHDAWTTQRVLELAQALAEEQLDQDVDLGQRTFRTIARHMVGNIEVWTDLMAGRAVRSMPAPNQSLHELAVRFAAAYIDFAQVARQRVTRGDSTSSMLTCWTHHRA